MKAARAPAPIPVAEALAAGMITATMTVEAMKAVGMTTVVTMAAMMAAMMAVVTMAATMTSGAYRGALANFRYQPSPAWVLRKMRCRVAASAGVSTLMIPGKAVVSR